MEIVTQNKMKEKRERKREWERASERDGGVNGN